MVYQMPKTNEERNDWRSSQKQSFHRLSQSNQPCTYLHIYFIGQCSTCGMTLFCIAANVLQVLTFLLQNTVLLFLCCLRQLTVPMLCTVYSKNEWKSAFHSHCSANVFLIMVLEESGSDRERQAELTWQRWRINYVIIFKRTRISRHNYKAPSLFLFLCHCFQSFIASLFSKR